MAQNRPPPAFQEYAASMMARTEYRVLNLAERGLLMTMRLECWVNVRLPEKPEVLAKVLGFERDEVAAALPAIMPFFAAENGHLIHPEHEDYRAHLLGIREKQAAGGKRGAEKTNQQRKVAETKAASGFEADSGNPRASRPSTRGSLVKSTSVQFSQTQPIESESVPAVDEWVNDYERASKGH